MAVSNRSFGTRSGRFHSAFTIINSAAEYLPSNPLISKADLASFVDLTGNINSEVAVAQMKLSDAQELRRHLSFKKKDKNPRCMEVLIKEIHCYIKADIQDNEGTLKIFDEISRKMNPSYKKEKLPAGVAENGKPAKKKAGYKNGKPSCEKTFSSLYGYAVQVNSLINQLGAAYQPTNTDIQSAQFQAAVTALENINGEITLFEQSLIDTIARRRDLYDGKTGMKERIALIKNYLKSLQGGKKNLVYINFTRTLRGV
ncbi:MAG: hypothetical protein WCJ01_07835 [Ignavibacteria bacterium]